MTVFSSDNEHLSPADPDSPSRPEEIAGKVASMGSPRIVHLYVSAGHNYFGRHDLPPNEHETVEKAEILCAAGRGIEGDRFFDYKTDYKGQITFFAAEIFDSLCARLGIKDKTPAVLRRNVVTRGMDLSEYYGKDFEIQGVRFHGMGECKPCYWMDRAFAPGAEAALQGCGGLRAKILSTGKLAVGAAAVTTHTAGMIRA